jgi:hypothetical protein
MVINGEDELANSTNGTLLFSKDVGCENLRQQLKPNNSS